MTLIAVVVGAYLFGGVPTAEWLASARGIDLRGSGSGNPGANNARRVGGAALGAMVLAIEAVKGMLVIVVVRAIDPAMVPAAAVAAAAGNVISPYRRLSGGQGLGITLGLLLGSWPLVVPAILAVIGLVAAALHRAPEAAIAALSVLVVAGWLWTPLSLPTAWGVPADLLPAIATGLAVVLTPKQVRNLVRDRRRITEVRRG